MLKTLKRINLITIFIMFKKWKDRDNDKDKKKEIAKREASRSGKEKKSFTEVLAGFENKSSEPKPKEKGGTPRRSLSEKRRQDEHKREQLFRQQTVDPAGGARRENSAGINGKVNTGLQYDVHLARGREAQIENNSQNRSVNAESHTERRPSVKSKFEVTLSKNTGSVGGRDKQLERQESIKVSSGSEVTVNIGSNNIGLSSEIMAGLDNGTREFLRRTPDSERKANNLKGVDLHLPELRKLNSESGRVLHVKRRPIGDFGFALRRSTLSGDKTKMIHLAEPLGDENNTGLIPGDRLVEVNGRNVENSTREEIIDMISASGDEVVLRVVPVPELAEFSSRTAEVDATGANQVSPGNKAFSFARSGSMRTKRSKVSWLTNTAI